MPTTDSSLLDTRETSVHRPKLSTYQSWLLRGDRSEWDATDGLWFDLHQSVDDAHHRRFLDCRTRAFFTRDDETGHVHVTSNWCRDRWCPLCANAKARDIAVVVNNWARTLNRPKLLTLTLKSTHAPLEHQVVSLHQHRRKWLSRQPMKRDIHGGIWFLQITYNNKTEQWHPHLHALLDAEFIPRKLLSRKWKEITRTSDVIDIRTTHSLKAVTRYVSRYVSRPCALAILPPSKRTDIYHALQGKRLAGTWGSARGLRLTYKPLVATDKSTTIGSFSLVCDLVESDERARQIWISWHTRQPLAPGISVYDPWFPNDALPPDYQPEPPPEQLRFSDLDLTYIDFEDNSGTDPLSPPESTGGIRDEIA